MTYKQRVLSVYPETIITRTKPNKNWYIGTSYKYIVEHYLFSGFGDTPKEAWEDAWGRVQVRMLEKLAR